MGGDVFRVHSLTGMSQIEGLTGGSAAVTTGVTLDTDWLTKSDDKGILGAGVTLAEIPIIDNGFKYKIAFEDNSGDLPDMVCNTDGLRSVYRMAEAAYVSRDEPDRVYFVDTRQGSTQPAYSAVAIADLTHPSAITAGDTIYVGEQRCDVVSSDADLTVGLAAEASVVENYHSTSVVCAQALSENTHSTADAIVTHDPIEVAFEGSTRRSTSTYELMDNNDIAVNDRVSLRTLNDHTYETRTVDYIAMGGIGNDNFFTVSQPFTAEHDERRIHLNFKGTTSSAACSGRGLCDGSSAECQCFKGYTGQACQIQNALAA